MRGKLTIIEAYLIAVDADARTKFFNSGHCDECKDNPTPDMQDILNVAHMTIDHVRIFLANQKELTQTK